MKNPNQDRWLQEATGRLYSDGFNISQNVTFRDQPLKLVAHRSRIEFTKFGNCETFFVFAEFAALNAETMRRFSAFAFDYAMTTRKVKLPCGFFEALYCFAIAMVDTLDPATIQTVKNEVPAKHWAAAEVPVVYVSGSGELCYFEKTPLWGAAYYAGFRKQIERMLRS